MTRVITRDDAEWPRALEELGPHQSPERLFVEGLALRPHDRCVAVVGTRRPSVAGLEIAAELARRLAEAGFVVVSGLAVGIDATAHQAALDAGGTTVAVLGCGLDVDYPRRNRSLKESIRTRGTLVTEYPEGTQPHKVYFPLRNRIIAGLSSGVVVIEGGVKSGALVTARLGLDANRSVFAVPGSVRNPMATGPNELIRRGVATLVTSAEHVFEDLAPSLIWDEREDDAAPSTTPTDAFEVRILESLDDVAVSPDRLAMALDVKPGKLGVTLAKLEVRGLVNRSPAGYSITSSGARAREVQAPQ